MNRITQYFAPEPLEPDPAREFFVVQCGVTWYVVSREMAEHIVSLLGRRWPPRWIRFTDLSGSLIRVRSRYVDAVSESTPDQRAFDRAFKRARETEDG